MFITETFLVIESRRGRNDDGLEENIRKFSKYDDSYLKFWFCLRWTRQRRTSQTCYSFESIGCLISTSWFYRKIIRIFRNTRSVGTFVIKIKMFECFTNTKLQFIHSWEGRSFFIIIIFFFIFRDAWNEKWKFWEPLI